MVDKSILEVDERNPEKHAEANEQQRKAVGRRGPGRGESLMSNSCTKQDGAFLEPTSQSFMMMTHQPAKGILHLTPNTAHRLWGEGEGAVANPTALSEKLVTI